MEAVANVGSTKRTRGPPPRVRFFFASFIIGSATSKKHPARSESSLDQTDQALLVTAADNLTPDRVTALEEQSPAPARQPDPPRAPRPEIRFTERGPGWRIVELGVFTV